MRSFVNHPKSQIQHADLQHTRIVKDNADVTSIINTLENEWVNPMGMKDVGMVCISTGRLASQEVIRDLSRAHDLGERSY